MLGTLDKQNKIRIFYEYGFLASIMIILSIILVSFWSYYLLSLNDFITFSYSIYFESLAIVSILFILLLAWIYIFFTKNNNKII
jgi:polyferredoxin